jgi:hypothetical protein
MIGVSRVLAAASLAACAALLTSCNDGLLHAPAPAQPARVLLRTSFTNVSGGASEAYDKTDRVFLRFRVGDDIRFEQELPFSPAGAQTSVRLEVPLRQLSETVNAELELRSATRPVFRGNASATLTSGVQTPLEFTLAPVVASVACGSALVQLSAYGQTAQLGGVALFATGDTVRDIPVTWSAAQNLAVSVSEAGEVTALQDGDATATCTANGFTATRSIRVFAVVSTVQVSPSSGTLVVGNTLPLTATLLDSRGNAILTQRPLTWSSGATGVATVSATGVVTGVVAGSARITATSGTANGGSDVTVVLTSTAVTNAAINVTGTGATLLGTVNPRGAATNAWFEWSTSPDFTPLNVTPTKSVGSGTADVALIETLSGLTPGTTYYFRTVSSGVGGTSRGATVFFVTPRLPLVTTLSTSISQIIVAGGNVTPNGTATTAWFRYGTSPTLSTFVETTHRSVGSGTTASSLTEPLTGLSQFTTYYVRAVATNLGGTALGNIVSFTTGGQPSIVTSSGVYTSCFTTKISTCANLFSSTNPNGMPTEVWFEWSTTQSFSSFTASPHQSIGGGNTAVNASFSVTSPFGGSIWYRVVASNAMGTVRTSIVQPTVPIG